MQQTRLVIATAFAVLTAVLALSWGALGETGGNAVAQLYQASYVAEAKASYPEALNKVQEILRREPRDYVAQLRLGWLLYLNKQYPESTAAYRKAVTLAPQAVEPNLGLMLPLMASSKNQDALRVAETVLKVDPGNFLGRSRKAYLLYVLGRFSQAENEYRYLLQQYPSSVEMMSGLGWAQLKQGKAADARTTFEKLLRVSPDHAAGKAGLAACPASR